MLLFYKYFLLDILLIAVLWREMTNVTVLNFCLGTNYYLNCLIKRKKTLPSANNIYVNMLLIVFTEN